MKDLRLVTMIFVAVSVVSAQYAMFLADVVPQVPTVPPQMLKPDEVKQFWDTFRDIINQQQGLKVPDDNFHWYKH